MARSLPYLEVKVGSTT